MVPTNTKDGPAMAVAGMIHQDSKPELGKYQIQRDIARKRNYRVLVRVSVCLCVFVCPCLCVCFCTITQKEIDIGTRNRNTL